MQLNQSILDSSSHPFVLFSLSFLFVERAIWTSLFRMKKPCFLDFSFCAIHHLQYFADLQISTSQKSKLASSCFGLLWFRLLLACLTMLAWPCLLDLRIYQQVKSKLASSYFGFYLLPCLFDLRIFTSQKQACFILLRLLLASTSTYLLDLQISTSLKQACFILLRLLLASLFDLWIFTSQKQACFVLLWLLLASTSTCLLAWLANLDKSKASLLLLASASAWWLDLRISTSQKQACFCLLAWSCFLNLCFSVLLITCIDLLTCESWQVK